MFNAHLTFNGHPLTKNRLQPFLLAISFVLMWAGPHLNETFAIPSVPDVVDHVTIQHPGNGFAASYTLPIYQIGNIRFLSAGVGLEERTASYPPFPLKLIFAEAGGAFITRVSVTIQDSSGKEILKIPEARISGPWLFLDLSPGMYQVTAVRKDGTSVTRTIQVPKGKTKGVHLHWPSPKGKG